MLLCSKMFSKGSQILNRVAQVLSPSLLATHASS